MNYRGVWAVFKFEINRTFRTIIQSILSPVISTMLYFIVFGSAIGSHVNAINGIAYAEFIVPGLIMITILEQSISNASLGIYLPRFTGTIYEILSAPISSSEFVIAYVGSAATKSLIIGSIVFITINFFIPVKIMHPFWMMFFLITSSIAFSLLGFIIGILADGFEHLQLIPLLVVAPLSFLGGSFYSLHMLPIFWQKISLLNPVLYLISGFRWSFYESTEVSLGTSITMISIFILICLIVIIWIFKTGYKLKS